MISYEKVTRGSSFRGSFRMQKTTGNCLEEESIEVDETDSDNGEPSGGMPSITVKSCKST